MWGVLVVAGFHGVNWIAYDGCGLCSGEQVVGTKGTVLFLNLAEDEVNLLLLLRILSSGLSRTRYLALRDSFTSMPLGETQR